MYAIRPIEPRDDSRMAAIARDALECYGLNVPGTAYFDPQLDHLSEYYRQTDGREYFVAVGGRETVAGGAGVGEYAPAHGPAHGIAELQKLYIAPEARGHRLSYRLLDATVAFARRAGYRTLYLETHHNLTVAVHLYERYGFARLDHPLGHGEHTTMDMFYSMEL